MARELAVGAPFSADGLCYLPLGFSKVASRFVKWVSLRAAMARAWPKLPLRSLRLPSAPFGALGAQLGRSGRLGEPALYLQRDFTTPRQTPLGGVGMSTAQTNAPFLKLRLC